MDAVLIEGACAGRDALPGSSSRGGPLSAAAGAAAQMSEAGRRIMRSMVAVPDAKRSRQCRVAIWEDYHGTIFHLQVDEASTAFHESLRTFERSSPRDSKCSLAGLSRQEAIPGSLS